MDLLYGNCGSRDAKQPQQISIWPITVDSFDSFRSKGTSQTNKILTPCIDGSSFGFLTCIISNTRLGKRDLGELLFH